MLVFVIRENHMKLLSNLKIGIHDADIHSDLMGSKYNTRIRMQNLKSIGEDKRYSINNTHAGFKNIDLSIA